MTWYKPWTWGDESSQQQANDQNRSGLQNNAAQAGGFGYENRTNYTGDTNQLNNAIGALQDQAAGKNSLVAMQLKQALAQNQSAQLAAAAGASPQNAVMAARTAAIQNAKLGSGLAGQSAMAQLQERNQAQQLLAQILEQKRLQDQQGVIGGYQTSNQALGAGIDQNADQSWAQRNAPLLSALAGGASVIAKSDRRAKTDIEDGDKKASELLEGLKAYSFKYKDEKDGKGEQFGIMAQDLEKVAPHAVIDTPSGKYVHGGKLATSLAAALPLLDKRLKRLESARDSDDEDEDEDEGQDR